MMPFAAGRHGGRAAGLAALLIVVSAFKAEASQPAAPSAEPLQRIAGVITKIDRSEWAEEPGMVPPVFFTLHTDTGDVSEMASYGMADALGCNVGARATLEGYYPADRPHEIRYFRVMHFGPCEPGPRRKGAFQADKAQAHGRP
jgi:hypothetical protein